MKINVWTIFDAKGSFYSIPFFYKTEGEAIRTFADLANDEKTSVGKHPEDYSLWKIGEFNDETGSLEGGKLECLCSAASLVSYKSDTIGNVSNPAEVINVSSPKGIKNILEKQLSLNGVEGK